MLFEVWSWNKLKAGIGEKDKGKFTKDQNILPIPVAYVMGSKMKQSSPQNSPPMHLYEDIGLLMTVDETGKGVKFYQHNRP